MEEETNAFDIVCSTEEILSVSEEEAAKVLKQSDYFRVMLSSGFEESTSRRVKKAEWSLSTAKWIVRIITNEIARLPKDCHEIAGVMRAASELGMTLSFQTHDLLCDRDTTLVDMAESLEQTLALDVCKDPNSIRIPIRIFSSEVNLSAKARLETGFLPTGDGLVRWNEYNDADDACTFHGGLSTFASHAWMLGGSTSWDGTMHFCPESCLTIGHGILKARDACYISTNADATGRETFSLVVKAEALANGNLEQVKETCECPSLSHNGLKNASPELMVKVMDELFLQYAKMFKSKEEATKWFSSHTAGLVVTNPTVETINLTLLHLNTEPDCGPHKWHVLLRWPSAIDVLKTLAQGSMKQGEDEELMKKYKGKVRLTKQSPFGRGW